MAKIDKRDIKLKKPNKRKLKEILEADSPTSKFKKLGNFNSDCVINIQLFHLPLFF